MPKHLQTGSLKTINGASLEGAGNLTIATTSGGADYNYIDIGDVRIQWGTNTSGSVGNTSVTLPASFADSTYSVTGSCLNSSTTCLFKLNSITASSFSGRVVTNADAGTSGIGVKWIAIGKKPA